MNIKILGTGCPNCLILEKNTRLALEKLWLKATITKVTDIAEIANYNIMANPGFVIDEKVMSSGKVLDVAAIVDILKWKIPTVKDAPRKCGCSCSGH